MNTRLAMISRLLQGPGCLMILGVISCQDPPPPMDPVEPEPVICTTHQAIPEWPELDLKINYRLNYPPEYLLFQDSAFGPRLLYTGNLFEGVQEVHLPFGRHQPKADFDPPWQLYYTDSYLYSPFPDSIQLGSHRIMVKRVALCSAGKEYGLYYTISNISSDSRYYGALFLKLQEESDTLFQISTTIYPPEENERIIKMVKSLRRL